MEKHFSISKWIAYLFLTVLSIIWVVPIIFGLTTSFRSQTEVVSDGFRLLPVHWVIENYIEILNNTSTAPIVRWLGNSLFIATTHTILVVFVISFTAYGYTRISYKYKDQIFFLLLGISMFPGIVNIIPSYKIVQMFGWVNTPAAMIIPGLAGMGNIFLVRQFMRGIPKEFDESARIDGAGEFAIYSKIMLPMIRPVLIVCGLFSFSASWNDFLWPVIVYNDVNKMPVTAGLLLLQDIYGNYRLIGQLMGSAFLAIIPTLLLFVFAQKYFVQSMNLNSGVKG
ncbi:carbohydrate ABC transporter permease [Melissococcus plutonius]|uniref:N-acetyl-D-glucosamine ABC transport system, permease protein 2 n=1 Tax=Melissococcus plutonius (strain ATCC 35311 / DSM 29964 / CIP 104052 / LMG 20360 / NCIMB 702443) TaxID=940190 RepID=F3Y7X4_MELPT|nr:carbohydrate ABC transporter permease [Melissococcus plutonius]AIM24360.1 ABC-type sugar transport system, permease component [Melissococcus plutonius S1]KMT25747.1 ABC-type sugar transport system, permease component [Melissococcus plutonius]KMT27092.1 ABC-type sugar transport system, permease component [Melissococcus plutonius]KMT28193.1 ABC-type sugar transport system, permease component [Melissococcus plutonius]KMT29930.1 ABC-type sugar transport system, permease component [Melissococcus